MAKQSFLTILAFCLLILMFTGCSVSCDDENCSDHGTCIGDTCLCDTGYGGENCEERLYLLKAIELSNEESYNFEYDSSNRISRIWHDLRISGAINTLQELDYSYSLDTILINDTHASSGFEDASIHKFVQHGTDSLVYTFQRFGGAKYIQTFSGLFDDCGYSFALKRYISDSSIISYGEPKNETYEYGDDCKLIVKNEVGDTLRQVEFDNRNYIYQNNVNTVVCCSGSVSLEQVTNAGNIVKRSGTYGYESTFTYNEADFPIEEVRRMNNGTFMTLRYVYY